MQKKAVLNRGAKFIDIHVHADDCKVMLFENYLAVKAAIVSDGFVDPELGFWKIKSL